MNDLRGLSLEALLREYERAVMRCKEACMADPRTFPREEYALVWAFRKEVEDRFNICCALVEDQ